MPKWTGRRLSIGIGVEGVRGTGVAASLWLNATAFSFFDKVTKVRTNAGYGGIWGGDQSLVAQKWADGEMEIEMGDQSFGAIMIATLGAISSAKYLGAYKHTFTLQNDNAHDSLSIQTVDPIGDLTFELSMIESLTIEVLQEALVMYTVAFKSKPSQAGTSTASYVAENKFLGRFAKLYLAANTGTLDDADAICVKRIT